MEVDRRSLLEGPLGCARIKVRRTTTGVPARISIRWGDLRYTLPIWPEDGPAVELCATPEQRDCGLVKDHRDLVRLQGRDSCRDLVNGRYDLVRHGIRSGQRDLGKEKLRLNPSLRVGSNKAWVPKKNGVWATDVGPITIRPLDDQIRLDNNNFRLGLGDLGLVLKPSEENIGGPGPIITRPNVGPVGLQATESLAFGDFGPVLKPTQDCSGLTSPVAHIFQTLRRDLGSLQMGRFVNRTLSDLGRSKTSVAIPGDPTQEKGGSGPGLDDVQADSSSVAANTAVVSYPGDRTPEFGGSGFALADVHGIGLSAVDTAVVQLQSRDDAVLEGGDGGRLEFSVSSSVPSGRDLPLVVCPLASFTPDCIGDGCFDSPLGKLVDHSALDGLEMPSPEAVSEWVLSRIADVSRLLGVSFEGHEAEALRLFTAVEHSWRQGASPSKDMSAVGVHLACLALKKLKFMDLKGTMISWKYFLKNAEVLNKIALTFCLRFGSYYCGAEQSSWTFQVENLEESRRNHDFNVEASATFEEGERWRWRR
ncbi:hypothetical protein LOK49_LG15G02449 [Camellia lanceoleosa]|uniref:Uncharacterized protein n=1 Tax=Camellia lanceoleosa TaxID=1840588 RepID=A0ACC0F7I0_9ERIC|nr:hypothetical protein LOK49_LG15G02449 [Camellia lanceoleosa]